MKTTVLLVIDHKRPIPDLLKLVEGRVYNLDAVEDCNASVAETPPNVVPLSDWQIDGLKKGPSQTYRDFARAIEVAHQIGDKP